MNIYKRNQENINVAIFYIIVLGALLLFGLNFGLKSPIWVDEIFSFYHSTGGSMGDFISQTESGLNRMPPMYFLLTKILFNDESYILNARILSIFFSSVTFLYLYKICNIWTDWSISFFLCTLTLFSSDLFLGYSFEARPYSFCMMLVTLFCFSIIKYESGKLHRWRERICLTFLCFLLPSSHYMYGITACALGLAHILFTKHNKFQLINAYFLAGIFFILIHFNIFLKQQNFGNILAFIAYPSKSKIFEYLLMFIPLGTTVIIIIFCLISSALNKEKKFHEKSSNIKSIGYMGLSLVCIMILGIIAAREFHGSIWFLPRYYLGGILIIAFSFIPLFSSFKVEKPSSKILIILLSLGIIYTNLLNFKKNRIYLYNNPQTFCYAYYPDKDLDTYKMPVVTDDPVLFFHYLYEGVNLYFLTEDKDTQENFRKFLPSSSNLIIDEVSFNSLVLLTTKNETEVSKSSLYKYTEQEFPVSSIHSAYLVQKL